MGGAWRGSGTNADVQPFEVNGQFLEVDPPRLLSFTWEPGHPESREGHLEGWPRVLGWLNGHLGRLLSA